MRVVSIIGPEQAGKTTIAAQLAGLEGGNPESVELFSGVKASKFSFMGEAWVVFDLAGGVQNIPSQLSTLIASDIVIVAVPGNTTAGVLTSPYIRFCEELDIPTVVFINKLDVTDVGIGEVISVIQQYSQKTITLRQVPIRKDNSIIGVVDLISERAWQYQDGARSNLISMPEQAFERTEEAREVLLEQLSDFDDSLLETLLEERKPATPDVFKIAQRTMMDHGIVSCVIGSAHAGNGMLRLMKLLRHETPHVRYLSDRLRRKTSQEVAFVACGGDFVKHLGQLTLIRPLLTSISSGQEFDQELLGQLTDFDLKTNLKTLEPGCVAIALKSPHLQLQKPCYVDKGSPIAVDWTGPTAPNFKELLKPKSDKDDSKLASALLKIAAIDAGIKTERDPLSGYVSAATHGVTHRKRVIEKIESVFDVIPLSDVQIPAYREALRKPKEKFYRHKKQSGGSGQFADVVIEATPLKRGEGFVFSEIIKGASVPKNYFGAVEAGAKEALEHGPKGFPVVDVKVTLKDGKHHDVDSSDFAFKAAARGATKEILEEVGTNKLQPISNVVISLPDVFSGALIKEISSLKGQVLGFEPDQQYKRWENFNLLLPAANELDLFKTLAGTCKGTAWFVSEFSHYEEVND